MLFNAPLNIESGYNPLSYTRPPYHLERMKQPPRADLAVNQRERICLRGFREKRPALVKLAEEYRSIRWGE